MSKINVLHLTYDMRIGGTETVIKNLVEGTDKSAFDVEILCIEPNIGPFGEQLLEAGYKIHKLFWQGGFNTKLIKAIRQFIRENQVDVLHCHQYTPWVYGVLAATFTSTKVIFTEHGRFYPDSSSWKRKLINPVLVSFTDAITTISKATKQALVDYEFIPQNKIDVIYNGIEPLVSDNSEVEMLRTSLGIPNDAKVLGTVARLDPIKNQTMMLKAFSQVLEQQKDSFLVIVGDGEEREKLESLADDLGISQAVKFIGYIAKPVNYIELMDVFLLSSLSEGTSMTLLEAMSLGKPCVVTDAGGNAEIIVDGKNGVVTANDNAEQFAHGILSVLNDNQSDYANQAITRYNQYFNCAAMVTDYQKIYHGLIK